MGPDMPDTARRPGDHDDLRVDFARFEGKVGADLTNLAHDVKNLITSLAAYATTRDLKGAEERIDRLEKNQTWITRTIVGAIVTALMGLVVAVAEGGHL